jgi:ATP-dependent DNA helicase RecG
LTVPICFLQFEFGNFFTAIFRRPHQSKNGAVNGAVKETTAKRSIKILNTLDEYSPLKISQLVVKTGISRRTLQRDISQLKKKQLLAFEGAPKTGGYIITRKGKEFVKDFVP